MPSGIFAAGPDVEIPNFGVWSGADSGPTWGGLGGRFWADLGGLWTNFRLTLGNFGPTLDQLWFDLGRFGPTLGRLQDDFGPTLGRLWVDFGPTLGQS